MTEFYDRSFNQNEWFVIIILAVGMIFVWLSPKRFPLKEAMVYFLYSVFVGMFFDKTISIEPFDFYDVNDNSSYQLMDFLSYWMYGPFGYFFVYYFDYFKIRYSYAPLYVLLWAVFSVIMEFFAQSVGVFHYKNGYSIFYSFPIYLFVLSLQIYLYKRINSAKTTK